MRSTRKNLVIDSPKQNTFKYERQQQFFSQTHYKKAQIKKCYTLLDNYTGQIFQTKQKPALDRYTSLNSIPLSKAKKPKELSLLIQQTSSQTSKKNSKNSRRLTFTPKGLKGQKIKQRKVVQVEDKTKKSLIDITKDIKNLVQSLKLYLFEVNSKMKQFMQYFISNFVQNWDDFKNQKERQKQKNTQMMSLSNQVVEKSFHIELEPFKVQKILDKYQKLSNQMQFMPTLNMSILNRQSSDINQQIGEENFPKKKKKIRQPQTQRFNAKKFEFDPPKNNSKNFSIFNETLNKMKRLTFQGSILKL